MASEGLVAVAINRDRGSQIALKWAISNLISRGQTLVLIHVLHKTSYRIQHHENDNLIVKQQWDRKTKDLFLPFHCYCLHNDVQCIEIVVEDQDITRAITEYASSAAIKTLVLGASRHRFMRMIKSNTPSSVSKMAPEFCNVYVIKKGGKISSLRRASRQIKEKPNISNIGAESISYKNNNNNNVPSMKCYNTMICRGALLCSALLLIIISFPMKQTKRNLM